MIALVTVGGLLAGVLSGDINMAGGMLVHQLSVLIVILNGMRLLRVPGAPKPATAARGGRGGPPAPAAAGPDVTACSSPGAPAPTRGGFRVRARQATMVARSAMRVGILVEV